MPCWGSRSTRSRSSRDLGWTWYTGGCEYPVFWTIVCLAVAIDAWKAYLVQKRPVVHVDAFGVPAE